MLELGEAVDSVECVLCGEEGEETREGGGMEDSVGLMYGWVLG